MEIGKTVCTTLGMTCGLVSVRYFCMICGLVKVRFNVGVKVTVKAGVVVKRPTVY